MASCLIQTNLVGLGDSLATPEPASEAAFRDGDQRKLEPPRVGSAPLLLEVSVLKDGSRKPLRGGDEVIARRRAAGPGFQGGGHGEGRGLLPPGFFRPPEPPPLKGEERKRAR